MTQEEKNRINEEDERWLQEAQCAIDDATPFCFQVCEEYSLDFDEMRSSGTFLNLVAALMRAGIELEELSQVRE